MKSLAEQFASIIEDCDKEKMDADVYFLNFCWDIRDIILAALKEHEDGADA